MDPLDLVHLLEVERQKYERRYSTSAASIRDAFNKQKGTTTIMQTTTRTARTKAGIVGQVVNASTDAIIWESSPYKATFDADGGLLVSAESAASKAATDKVEAVLENLFADPAAAFTPTTPTLAVVADPTQAVAA